MDHEEQEERRGIAGDYPLDTGCPAAMRGD